jgi:hypothetical protein
MHGVIKLSEVRKKSGLKVVDRIRGVNLGKTEEAKAYDRNCSVNPKYLQAPHLLLVFYGLSVLSSSY